MTRYLTSRFRFFTMNRIIQIVLFLIPLCSGDVYLHNPRGSNNRLNERSANRRNANRVFDSQNNNRGGYNAGDKSDTPATTEGEQYYMKYFQSGSAGKTLLDIEWTNQHGCGGNEDTDPHKQNCNIILQYMCQSDAGKLDTLRNGQVTTSQEYTPPPNTETTKQRSARKEKDVETNRVIQESWDWYDKCYSRERNKGLFVADQILASRRGYSRAISTRQNPNGNRRGYECPEERDHYPYWHPTPWKDIAVLAENASMCSHYQSNSFNVKPYGECVEFYPGTNTWKRGSRWNNFAECKANGGTWVDFYNYLEKKPGVKNKQTCESLSAGKVKYIWKVPYDAVDPMQEECLVELNPPSCSGAGWTRSNHLGNGREGYPLNYTWALPYFPSNAAKQCVLRIRYNISTDDYDPYFTDSSYNYDRRKGVMSPVKQNPLVEVERDHSLLKLAINTAQFGRTFQDRSHVFVLRPRTGNGISDQQTIHNLNVRGKRGNIVQVYPAVEYDFHPNTLEMKGNDAVHIQWTGSNSHNNQQPAGDGQAGDAGEGKTGTDRNNIVQIRDLNDNYPLPIEANTMWEAAEIVWIYHGKKVSAQSLALSMATSGFYRCMKKADCGKGFTPDTKTEKLNNLLNNAPASFEGAILKFKKGKYHFMCSRNNNFTNRSQKGTIIVL
ncbi:protein DD3-3-like isoform X2 [Tubulanus polymorphus]|uniref:protein DD3-3-like isoform X2 n=1 Tax=Tubulanus polymorphus TaxID=672921 RepID=UPI003DA2CF07